MKKRILFVDDEQMCLESYSRMLRDQRSDWECCFSNSADEALEKVREVDFDVIVSDLCMPGKDGFDLIQALRKIAGAKDVPVVFITGAGEGNLKRRALDLGATDLLSKPVAPEDLIARLRSVLRLKSCEDQIKSQNRLLERRVKERTIELEESRLDIVMRLAKAGEYRDEDTGNHTVRVAHYCRAIAEELNMPDDFMDMIFWASPLHDIGKIGIPDRILLKPGKLDADERQLMETHCRIGAEILLEETKGMQRRKQKLAFRSLPQSALIKMASTIALGHHEHWDGKGYPQELSGSAIPLESRIAALADVYDALISARPYKPAYPEDKALAIMEDEAGHYFDPEVHGAFTRANGKLRAIREQFPEADSH